jgi:hypothetical protein
MREVATLRLAQDELSGVCALLGPKWWLVSYLVVP